MAVFHAILPHIVAPNSDLLTQIATLTSLRLLERGGIGGDILDPSAKWKVNVGWEYLLALGRSVGCEVGDWLPNDV